MTSPIALEEAWERLLGALAPLSAEDVPVDETGGSILRADIAARRTQPYADLSAMDGFAVRGTEGPWRVIGEARAGVAFDGSLDDGEAVRISTGAALPLGGDAIVLVEDAQTEGDRLSASARPEPGRHIRRAGFDFAAGDTLVAAGTRITAPIIALARSGGHGSLPVSRVPEVAILECGDELVVDPAACPPDGLPASNGAMLARMVHCAGARAMRSGLVGDRLAAHIAAIEAASEADIVVTSGGASVGEHDLVRPALEALGYELDFWRVAIRPGKPLIVARRGTQLVLGLPGNPVSSYVTAFLFLLPAIRALCGASQPLPRAIDLLAATDLSAGGPRREFLRGRIAGAGVVPIAERDSSALRALAIADVLIDRPVNAPGVKAGTPVPCYWLENGANA